MAIVAVCCEPGCPRLSERSAMRRGRCPDCYRIYARAREKGRTRKPRQRGRKGQNLRAETLKRFGGRCAAIVDGSRCGETDGLEVHHVDGEPMNNTLVNRVPVCPPCHLRVQGDPGSDFALPTGDGGTSWAYFKVA